MDFWNCLQLKVFGLQIKELLLNVFPDTFSAVYIYLICMDTAMYYITFIAYTWCLKKPYVSTCPDDC